MMTKEEVTAIEEYRRENNTSCRKRIAELGISEWKFYQAKSRFSKAEDANGSVGFLQLLPDGNTDHGQCRRGMPASDVQQTTETGTQPVSIELWTPDGTAMRISGTIQADGYGAYDHFTKP